MAGKLGSTSGDSDTDAAREPQLRLVPATSKHISLLARLHAETFTEDHWPASWFESALKQPARALFLAFDGETAVGMIALSMVQDEAEILTLGVLPACRQRGVARFLLDKALVAPIRFCFLEVAADNLAALALYRSWGFEENGRRPNYYSSGADAILMMKAIDP